MTMNKKTPAALTLLLIALLSGCAHDVYTMADGQPITDHDKYSSDLYHCKMQAIAWYNNDPSTEDARNAATEAGIFAGLGGALGGAAAGATAGNTDREATEKIMTAHVGACMEKEGYMPGKANRS
jgi:hypothetical protein